MTPAQIRNAAIDECALAAAGNDKRGRDWVPGSFWDTLTRETVARIVALKTNEGGA